MQRTAPTRWMLLAVLPVTFLSLASEGALAPVLPLYAASLGAGATLTGVVIASYGIARFGLALPAGYVSDRFGRRLLLVSGPAFMALSSALAAGSDNLAQLIIYRFMAGAGVGLALTGAVIAIAEVSQPSSRAREMSLYRLSILLGVIVGPPLGGLVAATYGIPAAFLVAAGLAGMAAGWAYFIVPDLSSTRAAAVPESSRAAPRYHSSLALLLNRNLLLISFISFNGLFILMGTRQTAMPLLADQRTELSLGSLGLAFMLMSLASLLVLPAAGLLVDRLGTRGVILHSAAITSAGLALLALTNHASHFVAASLLIGLGLGLNGPAPPAYASRVIDQTARGIGMGFYQMVSDLGLIVGPLAMGALIETLGFTGALGCNAGLTLAVGAAFWFTATENGNARKARV